jgi:hypothetical protein
VSLLLAVWLALQGPFAGMETPDRAQTPGAVRPMTQEAICATAWGRDARKVTLAMRRTVFARQGIAWANRQAYEVDHLIPRSLGGADALENLWAQPGPGWVRGTAAYYKDRLEVRLERLVCAGRVNLDDARVAMVNDWRQAYLRFVPQQ